METALEQIISVRHPDPLPGRNHTHPFHELVYCLEGQGYVQINARRESFCANDYYVTRAGTVHAEVDEHPSQIIYFFFRAPAQLVAEGAYTDYSGTIRAVVNRLLRESRENLPQKEDMQCCLLTQILIETQRAASLNVSTETLDEVLQFINDNLSQDIDLHHIADRLNYSYDRFRHIFKIHTGLSPHQYILNARIERARFLMDLNPQLSLSRIALECGFTSASQFSNIFRTKTGISPTAYRKTRQIT